MNKNQNELNQDPDQRDPNTLHNNSVEFRRSIGITGELEGQIMLPGVKIGEAELSVGYDETSGDYYFAHSGANLQALRDYSRNPDRSVVTSELPLSIPNARGSSITIGRSGATIMQAGKPVNFLDSTHLMVRPIIDGMGPGASRAHITFEVTDAGIRYKDNSLNGTTLMNPKRNQTNRVPEAPEEITRQNFKGDLAQYIGKNTLTDMEIINVKQPEVGSAEKQLHGEDTLLSRPDIGLYGVFDGAGGHGNGDIASKVASREVNSHIEEILFSINENGAQLSPKDAESMLRDALINAGIAVNNEAKGGITTGTIVKLVESPDGKNYAVWASIGDSPLMVFNRRTSSLIRISTDEILSPEKPNVITNAIGHKLMEIRQIGHFELHDGDELVLCSDGITGDRHPDILLDSEISSALANAANTQQAAESLIADSRKRDDKAVLVIRP